MIFTAQRSLWCVALALLTFSVAVVSFPTTLEAQEEAIASQLQEKLDGAVENYDFLQLEDAKSKLEEAISLADQADVTTGPTLARVYIMLGIVRFASSRDEAETEDIFVQGVEADPDVEIVAEYRTPTLNDIMKRARDRAQPPESDTRSPVQGLTHDPVKTTEAGTPLTIAARIPDEMAVHGLFVHYKRYDQDDFSRIEMKAAGGGKFTATIPGPEIKSSQIEYYILVEDDTGSIVDQEGTPADPLSIVVLGSTTVEDDEQGDVAEVPDEPEEIGTRRTWVYVSLLGGTGFGVMPAADNQTTANPERTVGPGFAAAFGHTLLDMGVTISEAFHLGIFFRFQFAPAQDFSLIQTEGGFPSTTDECLGLGLPGDCILGLKYKWFFKPEGPMKLYSSVGSGVGRVRNWVSLPVGANQPVCDGRPTEIQSDSQGNPTEVCQIRDTVRPGWVHFGAGAGLAYEVADFLDLNVDTYLMLLVPDVSINIDVSAGLTLRF